MRGSTTRVPPGLFNKCSARNASGATVWRPQSALFVALLWIVTLGVGPKAIGQTAPNITGLSLTSGTVGTSITVTGTNFGSSQGSITFNGTPAVPSVWNATTIVAAVPVGATTGNIVVQVAGLNSNGVLFTVIGPVSYVYDDIGRLIGVIDGYGNAATYSYDTVGNVLSINQTSASQISIIQFSPSQGSVGTPVTVFGTGFSAIASQDSVSFNGVSAVVNSATATQIQTVVPAGATTGAISVTSPAGTVTSTTSFTVTTGPNAPTITSFSPQDGLPGTALTISGTNFDPSLPNDKVRINATSAVGTGITGTTTLSATVPSATASGRVSLVTPTGKAVSTQDLYIPFGTHLVTDIGFTARITSGTAQPVSLAAGKIALLLFDASAGQQISVQMSSSTFPSCTLYVVAPDNSTVTSNACTSGNSNLSSIRLPKTGTYTIGIDPGTSAGSITITLTPDVVGSIVAGGPAVTVTTTQPGQSARLTFSATSNQRATLNISNSSFQYCNLTIYKPDGSIMGTNTCTINSFWDLALFTPGGMYTFVVTAPNNATGHVTLQLYDASDVNASISIDGPAVTMTTTSPGQDARARFSATAGQRIVVYVTNVTNPNTTLNLVRPDGTNQTSMSISNNPSGTTFFIDAQSLTMTGTYQLWLQHNVANIGSETLQIASVPPDFTATLTVPSPGQTGPVVRIPAAGSLAVGQNAMLSFPGTASQKLSFNVTGSTIGGGDPNCFLNIYDPSNTQIYFGHCGAASLTYIDSLTLASTGTYSIVVNPQGTTTGSVSISINNDSDVAGSIAVDGAPVTVTTTVAGQDARLSFSAPAGQRIVVYATNVSNPAASVHLVKPDGTDQASFTISSGPTTFYLDTQTLTTAGTYQLWVKHSSTYVGSETLQIASVPPDFTGSLTVPAAGQIGPAVRIPTTGNLAAGQNAALTFNGTAGQKLSFNLINSTIGTGYGACSLRILDPNNSQIVSSYCGSGIGNIDTITLASTGTYTITLDPQGSYSGSISVSINNDADAAGTIAVDGSPVTATTISGQDARLSFSATAAQRIVVYATSVSNPSTTVYLVKPDGTNQTSLAISNSPTGQTFFLDTQTLATAGTYQLWVKHSLSNAGSETLQISSVPADLSGSVTIGGSATPVSTVAGQNANITFNNPQSQNVTVHWTSSSYPATPACYLRVTGPSPSTTQVGFANCNNATGALNLGTRASGTYNILVDPQAQSTGGLSLTVTSP